MGENERKSNDFCKKFIIFYQNEKNYSPTLMTKTLGYMHMFFLRHIIKWDYDKINSQIYDPARAKDIDFEKKKRTY